MKRRVANPTRLALELDRLYLTVTDAALAVQRHRVTVSRVVHGHDRPSAYLRDALAELVNLPVIDLFDTTTGRAK